MNLLITAVILAMGYFSLNNGQLTVPSASSDGCSDYEYIFGANVVCVDTGECGIKRGQCVTDATGCHCSAPVAVPSANLCGALGGVCGDSGCFASGGYCATSPTAGCQCVYSPAQI